MNKALINFIICLPLLHLFPTSRFGYRVHPITGKYVFHSGIDLRANHDTVFAIMDGFVKSEGYSPLIGIDITLDHGEVQSGYGHLSQLLVFSGDSVRAGQPIGITGNTGRVTGGHLHFSIHYKNKYIDPLKFLNAFLITKNHE